MAYGCLNTYTLENLYTEPTTESINRLASPNAGLLQRPCGRVIGAEDHGAAVGARPPRPITPPLFQQSPDQGGSALDKEEEDHDDK